MNENKTPGAEKHLVTAHCSPAATAHEHDCCAQCPPEVRLLPHEFMTWDDVLMNTTLQPQALMRLCDDVDLYTVQCKTCNQVWFSKGELFEVLQRLERTDYYELFHHKDIYCYWWWGIPEPEPCCEEA